MAHPIGLLSILALALGVTACASVEVAEPRYATRLEDVRPGRVDTPGIRSPLTVELATPRYATRLDEARPAEAAARPAAAITAAPPPPQAAPQVVPGPRTGSVSSEELPPLAQTDAAAPRPPERRETPSAGAQTAAAPPPVRAAAAGAPAFFYVAQPGDTLAGIGRRFGTPVQRLIDLNGLTPGGSIQAGQRVGLPAGATDLGVDPYATGGSGSILGATPERLAAAPPPPPPPAVAPARVTPQTTATAPVGAVASASAKARGKFIWPVQGEVISAFGAAGSGLRNDGINIAAPDGSPVRAAAAGEVVYAGSAVPEFGNVVLIRHPDGWVTAYGHLGSISVKNRDRVTQGQPIGTVGASGGVPKPQLHFELRYSANGRHRAAPVDPGPILP